jgi:ribose transport system substrate-binding protein
MTISFNRVLRRLFAAFAALAVVAVVAGCGGSSAAGGDDGAAAPAAKTGPYTVGYDVYWLGNSWSVQLYQEFKASVGRNKSDVKNVVYTQSDNQVQKQISNIQSMIARKVDAIIMTPISPSATVPVIKQAEAAGIPVVLLSAEADTKDYTALVTVDQKKFGAAGAEWLAKSLGGKGNIYALNGVAGLSTDSLRFAGAKAVFAKYPGIKIVADTHASWDEAQAARKPLVPMVGENNNGLMKQWLALRGKGDFDSVGVTNPTWLADDALKVTIKALKGEKFQKDNVLTPPTITNDDLEKFARKDLPDSFWVNTRLSDAQVDALFAK